MDNAQLEDGFRTFRTRLLALASRNLNPRLSARLTPEDVLQETMAAVAHDESPFMNDLTIPLYLRLRTALLQVIAQLERRHLSAQMRDAFREAVPTDDTTSSSPWIERIPGDVTSPVSRLARDERAALLHEAVSKLSDDDQAILELRHDDGLGNGECAALLGISEAAASVRYVRALRHLRELLLEYSEFHA